MIHALYNGRVFIETPDDKEKQVRYKVIVDNEEVEAPSVTSVTGQLSKGDALLYWATGQMADYLLTLGSVTPADIMEAKTIWREVREEAANYGSLVHAYAESYAQAMIQKLDVPEIGDDISDPVKNGINAFLQFIDENHIEFVSTETVIYSLNHTYVGRLDALARVNGVLTLIDYKTSKKSKTSSNGIYDEARMQVTAYQRAYEEQSKTSVPQSLILRFDKETGELGSELIKGNTKWWGAFHGLLQTKHALTLKS